MRAATSNGSRGCCRRETASAADDRRCRHLEMSTVLRARRRRHRLLVRPAAAGSFVSRAGWGRYSRGLYRVQRTPCGRRAAAAMQGGSPTGRVGLACRPRSAEHHGLLRFLAGLPTGKGAASPAPAGRCAPPAPPSGCRSGGIHGATRLCFRRQFLWSRRPWRPVRLWGCRCSRAVVVCSMNSGGTRPVTRGNHGYVDPQTGCPAA